MDNYKPRLEKLYNEKLRSSLKEQFKYKNDLMIPKLEKVVLNMGIGEAVADTKKVKSAHNDLMLIAGQLPVFTKAKKSIAGCKVREGMQLGAKVTLRRWWPRRWGTQRLASCEMPWRLLPRVAGRWICPNATPSRMKN